MRPVMIAALFLFAAPTLAQTVTHGLGVGQDPVSTGMRRLDTGNDSRGWEAVGRLELGGKGFCTAAMIEPNLVLTAAHCLWDKTTGDRVDLSQIEFRAGWRNGRAVAYRKIRRGAAHPAYVFTGVENLAQVPHDLALLELDSAIRLPTIKPYPLGPMPQKGDQVGIVSYARLRSEAPSLQDGCTVLSSQPGVAVMSCDVDFGSSGAPVFSLAGGRPRIVSVVTAKAEMNGEKVSLGMDMQAALGELRAELDKKGLARTTGKLPQIGKAEAGQTLGGPITGQAGGGTGSAGGAKFVRSRPAAEAQSMTSEVDEVEPPITPAAD